MKKINTWYVHKDNSNFLVYTLKIINDHICIGYGFNAKSEWVDENYFGISGTVEATTKQIEHCFTNIAMSKGLIGGATTLHIIYNEKRLIKTHSYKYYKNNNTFYVGNDMVFYSGKWATVVKKEVDLTVSEISERLGYAVRVIE